ncbi:MAG: hypothetical protein HCA25_05050 [Dolichospermum sp. DET50]|jgi:hypothetical protein|nr:hypothetical protein [Dolichospermum sp. DET66]MBS3031665.1 hypothetical protein [Dolichospermum sp. DET67]MBS3036876.1 hypothetical protein [Dolichospermum sp. DET50]QSX68898.1 MAG: hypothetical protein EZY12_04220 [Dolichospermum sp. DET69]
MTKTISNAIISVESYQTLVNQVKQLEERILNQESKILRIEAVTSKMNFSDNGFQEWNDPEEDIYNDEA